MKFLKQYLPLVIAGAAGAMLTIVIMKQTPTNQQSAVPHHLTHHASTAFYTPSGEIAGALNFTYAAERAMPAVVQIKAKESDALARERRQEQRRNDPWSRFFEFDLGQDFFNRPFGFPFRPREGAGSGVIISTDGYIVTNNHVIDFADEVLVKTFDGSEYDAEIVGRDPSTDLAVLRIDAKNIVTLEYGDSDKAKVGEWVLAVGNPFEYLTSTVTAGIISAKGRNLNIIRGDRTIEEFIQTDAAINPGNSGGALVDVQGRLLGINTAIASPTGSYTGYSFAIPVNLMSHIVDDIIKNGGVIERTNLGVIVEELDPELSADLGLGISKGLIVRELINGGAAQYAGILPNDVIVKVDGKQINAFSDIKGIMDFTKVGDTLKITVYRKGEYLDIPVRLRKRI